VGIQWGSLSLSLALAKELEGNLLWNASDAVGVWRLVRVEGFCVGPVVLVGPVDPVEKSSPVHGRENLFTMRKGWYLAGVSVLAFAVQDAWMKAVAATVPGLLLRRP
jgi:hypothetical protein